MTQVVGVDLGTTNSLAAVLEDGRPRVLEDDHGRALIPSVVCFLEDGSAVVGEEARALALDHPEASVFSVKRLMGRSLEDLDEEQTLLPYDLADPDGGLVRVQIGDRSMTPQEVSALILGRIREVASARLGEEVHRMVVTVPASFDDAQRNATRAAAKLAGLDVLRILNEPTAAALAYGLDHDEKGTVAVYDLGGGTFDCSILALEDGVYRVLSTCGDPHLGGDDMDAWLMDQWRAQHADVELDARGLQALRFAAEDAKRTLGESDEVEVELDGRSATVARADFEAGIAPLLERTADMCRRAVKDAGIEAADLGEVVLVGGATRTPAVRRTVAEVFGREPLSDLDPDRVVAMGAAVQAGILSGSFAEMVLVDVTPLTLGYETMGGVVSQIISRNSPVPCQASEEVTTYAEGQTGVDFHIVQGEREMAADCRTLGRLHLTGIPPMAAGMARVKVTFTLDSDGILSVGAVEERSGVEADVTLEPKHGLTDEQVEVMLKSAWENAEDDFAKRRCAELLADADMVLRSVAKHGDVAEARMEPDERERLKEAVADMEEAVAEDPDDGEALQSALDELNVAAQPLATVLMSDVAAKALSDHTIDEAKQEFA